jgi:prophage maintenance system killer protein
LQVDGILAIHKIVKQKAPADNPVTTGKPDVGIIQGIIEKPELLVNGKEKYDDIYKKPACLLEGIVRLHPFTDGNKRTALYNFSLSAV